MSSKKLFILKVTMTTAKEYNQFSVSIYPIDNESIMRMDNTLNDKLEYILFDVHGCSLNKGGLVANEKICTVIFATEEDPITGVVTRRLLTTSQLEKFVGSRFTELFGLKLGLNRPMLKIIDDKVHISTIDKTKFVKIQESPVDIFDGHCFQMVRNQPYSTEYFITNLSTGEQNKLLLGKNQTLGFYYLKNESSRLFRFDFALSGNVLSFAEYNSMIALVPPKQDQVITIIDDNDPPKVQPLKENGDKNGLALQNMTSDQIIDYIQRGSLLQVGDSGKKLIDFITFKFKFIGDENVHEYSVDIATYINKMLVNVSEQQLITSNVIDTILSQYNFFKIEKWSSDQFYRSFGVTSDNWWKTFDYLCVKNRSTYVTAKMTDLDSLTTIAIEKLGLNANNNTKQSVKAMIQSRDKTSQKLLILR